MNPKTQWLRTTLAAYYLLGFYESGLRAVYGWKIFPWGHSHMLAGAVNYLESGMGLTGPLPRAVFEMVASWCCLAEGAFTVQKVASP